MMQARVLLLDNYDSFVFNLARYVRELGGSAEVVRNDATTVAQIAALGATHVIISPGPCTPAEAGISTEVVRSLGSSIPILGVCLGHQCIGVAYGASITRAERPLHGKTAPVWHESVGLFSGVPSPFRASRYHSLVVKEASIPPELCALAHSEEGEVMALRHVEFPVFGVQFHPESVATEYGYQILSNFLTGTAWTSGTVDPPENSLPVRADLGQSAAPGQPNADASTPPLVSREESRR